MVEKTLYLDPPTPLYSHETGKFVQKGPESLTAIFSVNYTVCTSAWFAHNRCCDQCGLRPTREAY